MIEDRMREGEKKVEGYWEIVFKTPRRFSSKPVIHWVVIKADTEEAAKKFFYKQIAGKFTELVGKVRCLTCYVAQ